MSQSPQIRCRGVEMLKMLWCPFGELLWLWDRCSDRDSKLTSKQEKKSAEMTAAAAASASKLGCVSKSGLNC